MCTRPFWKIPVLDLLDRRHVLVHSHDPQSESETLVRSPFDAFASVPKSVLPFLQHMGALEGLRPLSEAPLNSIRSAVGSSAIPAVPAALCSESHLSVVPACTQPNWLRSRTGPRCIARCCEKATGAGRAANLFPATAREEVSPGVFGLQKSIHIARRINGVVGTVRHAGVGGAIFADWKCTRRMRQRATSGRYPGSSRIAPEAWRLQRLQATPLASMSDSPSSQQRPPP